MKRTASCTNSVGIATIVFEAFGSLKHKLGREEFSTWLEHQSDTIGHLLPELLSTLGHEGAGSNYAQTETTEFTIEGTTVKIHMTIALWRGGRSETVNELVSAVMTAAKEHVQAYLTTEGEAEWAIKIEGIDEIMRILGDVGPLFHAFAGDVLGDLGNMGFTPFADLSGLGGSRR